MLVSVGLVEISGFCLMLSIDESANVTSFGLFFPGDKLRVDLRRKEVPGGKMAVLEQKFDEVKIHGLLMPSALSTAVSNTDELDNVGQTNTLRIGSRLVKRTPSANARKPQTLDVHSSGELIDNLNWIRFRANESI